MKVLHEFKSKAPHALERHGELPVNFFGKYTQPSRFSLRPLEFYS